MTFFFFSSRFPALICMKSLMLWLRRQQELSSLSSWRNLMKRISVRRPFSVLILSMHFCAIMLNCLAAYVSANDENGEKILHTAPSSPLPKAPALPPKQGWCQPHNPRADSNLSTLSTTVAVILVQIVGPGAPCPGPPLLTGVFCLHLCRPLRPTQWDDSSTPLRLSPKVSMQPRSQILLSS